METEQIKKELMATTPQSLTTIQRQGSALIPLIHGLATGNSPGLKLALSANFYEGNVGGWAIAKAAITKGTPFKAVAAELGPVKTIFLINEMIRNYCAQFNVSKNMTDKQMEDLAADLYLEFKNRTGNAVMLEEIAVFFDRLGKGEFFDASGKKIAPFDRIDRGLIETGLDVYFETDRTQAIWAMEDEREAMKRTTPPPGSDRLALEGGTTEPKTVGDIYTQFAGQPGKITLFKKLKEMGEGGGDQSQTGPV